MKNTISEGTEVGFRDKNKNYRIGCVKSIAPCNTKCSIFLPMTGEICFIHVVDIEQVIGPCSNIYLKGFV